VKDRLEPRLLAAIAGAADRPLPAQTVAWLSKEIAGLCQARRRAGARDHEITWLRAEQKALLGRLAELEAEVAGLRADATGLQVWPVARVLAEVQCGSQDWSWEAEWADLDQRHAASGYLDRLEQQIRTNGITLPLLIGSDGRLWDGHHRLRLAVKIGIGYVPVELTIPHNHPGAEQLPAPAVKESR
jgi:ParB-like chromosome segregation protein Spo0J